MKSECLGWVKRSADPTLFDMFVGFSLTLDPTYVRLDNAALIISQQSDPFITRPRGQHCLPLTISPLIISHR
jgi:hypothetical protein